LGKHLQNLNANLGSLKKYTQFQKKYQSNQIPDEGDIIDLKTTLF